MFDSLQIKNFKSWDDVEIKLDKGVNVIQGLSFSGKTNILRALRLLFDNRPQGAHFYPDFLSDRGKTDIKLKLLEGSTVGISKQIHISKKGEKTLDGTTYSVKGKGIDFESSAASDGAPDQVSLALNISELNMQRQFDRPFLALTSPGEVARIVNRITKFEEVDEWVSQLTSMINQNQRDVKRLEEESIVDQLALKKYVGIEETEIIVQNLQVEDKQLQGLYGQQFSLDRQLCLYENVQKALDKMIDGLLAEKYINKAEKETEQIAIYGDFCVLIEKWDKDTALIKTLEKQAVGLEILLNKAILTDTSEDENIFGRLQGLIQGLETLTKVINKMPDLEGIERQLSSVSVLSVMIEDYDKLDSLMDGYRRVTIEAEIYTDLIFNRKEEYIEVLKKAKKCPSCYAPIDAKAAKRIGEEL
jgi:hypothetical protein